MIWLVHFMHNVFIAVFMRMHIDIAIVVGWLVCLHSTLHLNEGNSIMPWCHVYTDQLMIYQSIHSFSQSVSQHRQLTNKSKSKANEPSLSSSSSWSTAAGMGVSTTVSGHTDRVCSPFTTKHNTQNGPESKWTRTNKQTFLCCCCCWRTNHSHQTKTTSEIHLSLFAHVCRVSLGHGYREHMAWWTILRYRQA